MRFKFNDDFPYYKQLNAMDCGPTCVQMVAKYYGKHFNIEGLRKVAGYAKDGVSLLGISESAEHIGLRTRGVQLTYAELSNQAKLPCILHWGQNHFVVAISFGKNGNVKIADPAKGIITYSKHEFLQHWITTKFNEEEKVGTALLLEPTSGFFSKKEDSHKKLDWRWVFNYVKQNQWDLWQVFVAILVASFLQLIFPLLTQSIVDSGIKTKNVDIITVLLIAQLILILSRNAAEFIRSRLLLQVSSVINISILSDFWIKLTNLPIQYFTTRNTGDTLQRIGDHKQIQEFLTGSAISTFFSLFNLVIYSVILVLYNANLFLIFLAGSVLYLVWIQFFLSVMRKINYKNFDLSSRENNTTLQMIEGMQEIKLNGAEKIKRWEWETIQSKIFKLGFKSLSYNQLQQTGATLINQGKDVIITFLVAKLVIDGQLTFGAMVAIQYIIGQMSAPVEQLNFFIQQAQDAKISLERLNEIHALDNEEDSKLDLIAGLPVDRTITFKNVSFAYPGNHSTVLRNIDLTIPEGKITAIVGVSGSGKTSLLKLLLKFYNDYQGEIRVGEIPLSRMSPTFWRKQCGAVLQDGFVFNDTIARNICLGEEVIDEEKLNRACAIANIKTFIESLPNGYNTRLGSEGNGISQGQRQRILIARAVYRNPSYIFLDEATNALDANNEKEIVDHLQEFFKGKTVVVVAHRLSTVKNADNIIVIQQGEIIEQGNHQYLSSIRGVYYELVKNQLELGS